MSFRRNYSQSLFSDRKRGPNMWVIFIIGLILGSVLVFLMLQPQVFQKWALEQVGIAPTPTPFASDYATWGMERYQQGDITGALELLQYASELRPDDVDYLYETGILLIENDRTEDAVIIGEQIIELVPGDPRGYALKGRALMWDDPITAIQVSILGQDVDPTFAPLYAIQGVAYTNLGRWNEGVKQGLQAIELAPNDAFVLRAIYTPMVYIGRYQDAIDYLERAISVNSNLTAPYFELASLYKLRQVNQPEMALAIYDRILELEPDSAKAYLRICETYANVENARFDVAQPYCDQAIEIDPQYGDAYMQRGRMQYLRRNYEGSIESFEDCIAYGSEAIECWYLRGLAHFFLNNCDQAWDILQQARTRAQQQGSLESIIENIEVGLYNITELCIGFSDRALPTSIPPTEIPPTPIGGFN
jgi:tetratricopeptide (TPR) repeat protein